MREVAGFCESSRAISPKASKIMRKGGVGYSTSLVQFGMQAPCLAYRAPSAIALMDASS